MTSGGNNLTIFSEIVPTAEKSQPKQMEDFSRFLVRGGRGPMSRMGAVLHPAYSGTIYPQQVRVPSPVSLCSLRRSPGALDSEPTTSGPPITRTVACFIQAPVVCSSTTCRQCSWLQLCVSCTVSSHRRCCDCTASSAPRLQISRQDSTRLDASAVAAAAVLRRRRQTMQRHATTISPGQTDRQPDGRMDRHPTVT